MYVSVNIHLGVLGTVPGRSTAELRVFLSITNTNTSLCQIFYAVNLASIYVT